MRANELSWVIDIHFMRLSTLSHESGRSKK